MKTPSTKPIEKVFIHVAGDKSVGINSRDFESEVFIDPKCYDETEFPAILEEIRSKFHNLYFYMHGENVTVLFDFEVFAMNELEDKMTTQEQAEVIPNKKEDNPWVCPHCKKKSDTWFDRSIELDDKGNEIRGMVYRCNNCGKIVD